MSEDPEGPLTAWLLDRVDGLITALPGVDPWDGREARLYYHAAERDADPGSKDVWHELHIRVQNIEGPRQGRTHVIRVAVPSGRLVMDAGASVTFFAPSRPAAESESSIARFIERRLRRQEEQTELTRHARAFLERIEPDLKRDHLAVYWALRLGLRARYRARSADVTAPVLTSLLRSLFESWHWSAACTCNVLARFLSERTLVRNSYV